jgi:glycosyltransferase involved in cell wall biosynthesis
MTKSHPDKPKIAFIFKNFSKLLNNHPYVIGLGIAIHNNAETLKQYGIEAETWGVVDPNDIDARIDENFDQTKRYPTFVIISAYWIPTRKLAELSFKYPEITFVVNSHSNISFMFADRNGIRLFEEGIVLQNTMPNRNILMAGNSRKFTKWASITFDTPVAFLPNLYNLDGMKEIHCDWGKHIERKKVKIGNFGATRILKGNLTACAASMEIGKKLDIHTEFWLNSGRIDGGQSILNAINELTAGAKHFKVKYKEWAPWQQFRHFIGSMDVNMQMSLSESFNMVLADSLYNAVPAIASEVVEWFPENCIANVDDPDQIANLTIKMLNKPAHYVKSGQNALKKYVKNGVESWEKFLFRR